MRRNFLAFLSMKISLGKSRFVVYMQNIFVLWIMLKNVYRNRYQLYCSMVLCYLNYGILLWGNSCKEYLSKVLRLQNRAFRSVSNSSYLSASKPLFDKYIKRLIIGSKHHYVQNYFTFGCDSGLNSNHNSPYGPKRALYGQTILKSYFVRTKQVWASKAPVDGCGGVITWSTNSSTDYDLFLHFKFARGKLALPSSLVCFAGSR